MVGVRRSGVSVEEAVVAVHEDDLEVVGNVSVELRLGEEFLCTVADAPGELGPSGKKSFAWAS